MINACGDQVIVDPIYEKAKGVIVLPDGSEKREGEFHGIVVSVGPECKHSIKPGDRILFRRHEGTELEVCNKKLLALKQEWVIAEVEA